MSIQNEDFLKTIHKHQGLIHKVCNIYRDNREDKEDLFQEITYQLWKSYPKFEGKSKITTWMYKIALNTAMASFRKTKVPISHVKELPDIQSEIKQDDVRKEKLFWAVRQLDDAEKAIISLYLDDYDLTEIADITGITKNNVSVRLNRIKNKIKTLINI
ncbi:sigma-70 family RNA polymerase sigma factor [Confluentibacter sediminis]|uniref:sigma-70 family RNA polymerase sigma factor n=1 Tax=Confluentibacter sediminis TaxID=2219045 RepID=UPI001C73CEF5|nr:sigma-70 family RNA polymerase sigma factor [Confluentibacter sediminis]